MKIVLHSILQNNSTKKKSNLKYKIPRDAISKRNVLTHTTYSGCHLKDKKKKNISEKRKESH
jgi:hypothetical protein